MRPLLHHIRPVVKVDERGYTLEIDQLITLCRSGSCGPSCLMFGDDTIHTSMTERSGSARSGIKPTASTILAALSPDTFNLNLVDLW